MLLASCWGICTTAFVQAFVLRSGNFKEKGKKKKQDSLNTGFVSCLICIFLCLRAIIYVLESVTAFSKTIHLQGFHKSFNDVCFPDCKNILNINKSIEFLAESDFFVLRRYLQWWENVSITPCKPHERKGCKNNWISNNIK